MKRYRMYRELTKNILDVKKPLFALSLFKIWGLFCGLIPLLLYSMLVNKVMIERNFNRFWLVLVAYFVVFILETFGISCSKKFSNQLVLKYDLKIKNKLLRQYTLLDNNVYKQYGVGDIKSRIENDSMVARSYFETHILDFTYSVISAVVLGIIMVIYDWRIALLSFIFVPITFVVINFIGEKTKKAWEKLWRLQTKYETFLQSTFQNWKDIKINNLEDAQFDEINIHMKKIRRIWFLNQLYWHLGLSYSFFQKLFITQLFLYFVGGVFVIKGYSQVGTLLVLINFCSQFYVFIKNISDSMMKCKNDMVNIEKVIEIVNLDIDIKPYIKIKENDIKVEYVRFAYKGNNSFLIKDLAFNICRGEHLAIVGESGSGKSTIVKLLTGQIAPHSGSVCIGGVDINTINSQSIAEKVSVVTQEPVLFNMTIRENLLLVKSNATDSELIECCNKASIYDFIETLPYKMDTVIGERGVKLSGGQKQRLSLARAFLRDKEIIIFDESTSALDSEKESDIINEIKYLSTGKTMISIAHRLSSALICDKVMVIKDGAIVAIDTHENLRNKNDVYDSLFKSQYS
ncbi:ABC transporter ATP-binding protein [Anaerocolumna jejuensis]|uniref:ABC transporter ATP-binding protein n=1 Tax=Anaerocolumna jejuensis TaxID=259063 RepID=UPI003F7CAF0A